MYTDYIFSELCPLYSDSKAIGWISVIASNHLDSQTNQDNQKHNLFGRGNKKVKMFVHVVRTILLTKATLKIFQVIIFSIQQLCGYFSNGDAIFLINAFTIIFISLFALNLQCALGIPVVIPHRLFAVTSAACTCLLTSFLETYRQSLTWL